jgi:hypothetical protein
MNEPINVPATQLYCKASRSLACAFGFSLLEGAESEKIVRADHNLIANPATGRRNQTDLGGEHRKKG